MAVTSKVYGLALQSLAEGQINYPAATVKVMACTASYSPDQDTHRYKASVTNEIAGAGYTAGGQTLANKSITYGPSTNTVSLDADNPIWPTSTFTLRYLVFYVDTGNSATSPLLAFVDFGADVNVAGVNFEYDIPAGGFCQLTAAA